MGAAQPTTAGPASAQPPRREGHQHRAGPGLDGAGCEAGCGAMRFCLVGLGVGADGCLKPGGGATSGRRGGAALGPVGGHTGPSSATTVTRSCCPRRGMRTAHSRPHTAAPRQLGPTGAGVPGPVVMGVCSGPNLPAEGPGPRVHGGAASLCPSLSPAGHVTSPRRQGQLTPRPCSPAQPRVTWSGASRDISATETEVTWSGPQGGGPATALWRGRVESPACTLHRCVPKDKVKPHHAPAFCANRETLDPNGWLTDWPGVHTPKTPGTRVPRAAPQDPAAALSTPGEGASWSLETVVHAPQVEPQHTKDSGGGSPGWAVWRQAGHRASFAGVCLGTGGRACGTHRSCSLCTALIRLSSAGRGLLATLLGTRRKGSAWRTFESRLEATVYTGLSAGLEGYWCHTAGRTWQNGNPENL